MRINSTILKTLSLISQLGITIIITIFVGLYLGKFLDGLLKTQFLTIIFLVFGILAAFKNSYALILRHIKKDENGS